MQCCHWFGFLCPPPQTCWKALLLQAKACRLRQHVNPLRAEYQVPREALDWSTVYADSRLPLVLDIGCAGGRFLLALANKLKGHNFLGLDIRNAVRSFVLVSQSLSSE